LIAILITPILTVNVVEGLKLEVYSIPSDKEDSYMFVLYIGGKAYDGTLHAKIAEYLLWYDKVKRSLFYK